LLRNVARQMGQAIESVWLRTAQQEEAWVNTALLKVAEAVNRLVDLNEILDTIVRLVPLLVGVDVVLILVWDEVRRLFYPGPSYGISPMGRGLIDTLYIDGEEFMRMTPELRDMEMAADHAPALSYYPIRMSGWLRTVLSDASAAHNFPLMARGRLVGAMIVGRTETGRTEIGQAHFSLRRLNILNGIAQQAATAVVNNQLYRESAERLRLQLELDVAHKIQASFLPDKEPDIPGCSVASFWQAARQVSGDFYDFLPLSEGRWGVVIADVADKGVPAALFMALSRTILRTVAFTRRDPAQVLVRTNEIIGKEARSDLFVTVFYGIWDETSERFIYANAGHNPPLLMRQNGSFSELPGHGIALGVLPEIEMNSFGIHLRPGETIIFYTDGVTEALNEDYDEFGMERLRVAAGGAARSNANAPEIAGRITDGIRDHAGDTPQFDDITLIVIKRASMQG
jgi:serine phosphatase RsbU (regulator of sigma subunit)